MGLIVGLPTPVSLLQGTRPPVKATSYSFLVGDEVEVWRDASVAWGSQQSPPGTPSYHATRIVIHRRVDQPGPASDTLVSCHREIK
jgi:hypothetical protein